ncbi:UPF0280 family protein [Chloroflexota bacterium]
MYEPRDYRRWIEGEGLCAFEVSVGESDLYIRAGRDLRGEAFKAVNRCRSHIEGYIERHPEFLSFLLPLVVAEDAPPIIKQMAEASQKALVGPMAAVAGAIAEFVGRELLPFASEVIVENGGDIFLAGSSRRLVGVYAGESPFTGKIALEIQPEEMPLGVCTSSGTVGHSLSAGSADAVIALSSWTALADAAATAIGNIVCGEEDIPRALSFAQGIDGLSGAAVIVGDRVGLWGRVKIIRTLDEDSGNCEGVLDKPPDVCHHIK